MTRPLRPFDPRVGYPRRLPSRPRRGRRRRLGRLVTALVVAGAAAGGAVAISSALAHKKVTAACTIAPTSGARFELAPDQGQNAAIIAAVGRKMGLPDHAATVALATALQESQLRNLPYGDLDSVGLFQQRPSQGWGTRQQLLDPVYAATAFYTRLTQIPGWQSMSVTDAAQAVQQ